MYKYIIFIAFTLFAFSNSTFAQTGSVAGTVVDSETGKPLPGANVLLTELDDAGTATETDGRFILSDIPVGDHTIRITFVGYLTSEETVEVRENQETQLTIELSEDISGLEEVVVTGVASRTSKAAAEVSVSRVDAEDLIEDQSYTDVSQLLEGKVAGAQVTRSSGNVGGGIRFNIRSGGGLNGTGQPVIYIDGVRVSNDEQAGFDVSSYGSAGQNNSALNSLNPENISSIDILKGPAASALYGTSGSNGVVLITTKQGEEGEVSARYRGTVGLNTQSHTYSKDTYVGADDTNNLFQNGSIYQNLVSVSGGSNILRYYTSVEHRYESGILKIPGNEMDRKSIRLNVDATPLDNLNFNLSIGYSIVNVTRPWNDNSLQGPIANTILSQGGGSPYTLTDSLAIAELKDETESDNFTGSLEARYSPFENFELTASAGHENADYRNDQLYPAHLSYSGIRNGQRGIHQRQNKQYSLDINAQYTYDLPFDLSATSIIGTQLFHRELSTFYFTKQDFPTELITNIGAGGVFTSGNETLFKKREAGIFAQQEMSYGSKVFFTLGGRRDYASTIGENTPSIIYPKASIAVRLDNFDIGALPSQISFLKLRSAYGESGVLPDPLDGSELLWTAESSGYGPGAVLDFIGNPAIKPERVRELEFGLETEFLEDYGLNVTYYRQWARESIVGFSNPPSTGKTASDVPFNVGAINGWGAEFELQGTPVRTQSTRLDLNLIWSYQDNEVKDLGGAPPIISTGNTIKEGLNRSSFYEYEVHGALFDENGEYAGVDADEERSYQGQSIPPHSGSFSVNLTVMEDLTLNVMTDWNIGNSVENATFQYATFYDNYTPRQRLAAKLGMRSTHPEADKIEALTPGTEEYREAAHAFAKLDANYDANFIERADFLKVRELGLRYDLADLVNSSGWSFVESMNLGFSARNVYTITPYDGPDPEINASGTGGSGRGSDFFTLMRPSTYSITLTMRF